MDSRLNDLFKDPTYPKLSIKQFVIDQLKISKDDESKVVDQLYCALTEENQNETNKKLIETALDLNINASGAIILIVKTDEGLKLVCAHSQRRNKLISTNGACASNESISETAIREFIEELGNPEEKGILRSIIANPSNYRSIAMSNKIGTTKGEIAARIIEKKADSRSLFINMSIVCVNKKPVKMSDLQQEINDLNTKLQQSVSYYQAACLYLYGNKTTEKANLADPEVKLKAVQLINEFKEKCKTSIAPSFVKTFNLKYDKDSASDAVDKALHAIVDLTENDKIELLPKSELQELLSLDFSETNAKKSYQITKDKGYFYSSLENLFLNRGSQSAEKYLSDLESLPSDLALSMWNKSTINEKSIQSDPKSELAEFKLK